MSRIFGVFVIIAALVLPSFAQAQTIQLGDIAFGLSVAPGGPLGPVYNDVHYFASKLVLNSPAQLSVGDTVITGARDKGEFAEVGLGLVLQAKAEESCVPRSRNVMLCNFAATIPAKRSVIINGSSLDGTMAFDKSMLDKLAWHQSPEENRAIAVIPYVKTADGKYWGFTDTATAISLQGDGRVLGIFSIKTAQAASIPKESITFGPLMPNQTSPKANSKAITKDDPLSFDMQIVINQAIKDGDCIQFKNPQTGKASWCVLVKSVYIGIVTAPHEAAGPSPKCRQVQETDLTFDSLIYQTCEPLDAKSQVIPIKDVQPGKAIPVKLDWGPSVRNAANANNPSAKGDDARNVFTAYLFFNIEEQSYTYSGTLPPLRVDGAAMNVSVRIFNDKAAVDAFNNDPNNKGVGQGGNCGLNCGTNAGTGGVGLGDFATGVVTFINTVLSLLIAAITEFLIFVFGYFIGPVIEAILAIRTYTNDFRNVIYPAWLIFRNIGSIFFILAIIAIGLGTIFRVSGWQAKDTLLKLVLGALLINFSLIFAQSILGIADTVQNQFLPQNTGAIRLLGEELLVNGSRSAIDNLVNVTQGQGTQIFGSFGETVRILTNFVVAVMAFIAFVAIALFLLIRIIFLWLLLMTSPVPYVAMILPISHGLMKRWWSNFIKYAFMTPAMAFMLNLTALIARDQRDVIKKLAPLGSFGSLNEGVATVMYALAANAVVIVFMYMSLKAASTFGAESGGLIEKVTDKGLKASVGVPLGAASWLGGVVNRYKQEHTAEWSQGNAFKRVMFAVANPITTTKAALERRKVRKEEIQHRSAAGAYDVVPTVTGPFKRFFGPKSRKYAALYGSEYSKINKDEMPWITQDHAEEQLADLIKSGKKDEQTRTRIAALLLQLAEDSDMNDELQHAQDKLGMSRNFSSDRHGYAAFFQELVDRGQLDHLQNGDLQARLTDIFKKNGTTEFAQQFRINDNGQLVGIEGKLVKKKKTITDPVTGNPKEIEYEEFEPHHGKDEKAWKDLHNTSDKHINKIGASKRAQQHYSNWTYQDTDGNRQLNRNALHFMAVVADQRDWNAAESLDPRARQYMVDAMRDQTNREVYKQEATQLIIDDIEKKRGVKVSAAERPEIERKAEERMKEFTQKYLLYDVDHDERLDREQKHQGEELLKNGEFVEIVNAASDSSTIKNAFVKSYDEAFYTPSSFRLDPKTGAANKLKDVNVTLSSGVTITTKDQAAAHLHDLAFDRLKEQFAEKIDPKKLNLLVGGQNMSLTNLQAYEQTIGNVMDTVRSSNVGMNKSLRNVAPQLQSELEAALLNPANRVFKSDGVTPLTPDEAAALAKRVFGSLTENRA